MTIIRKKVQTGLRAICIEKIAMIIKSEMTERIRERNGSVAATCYRNTAKIIWKLSGVKTDCATIASSPKKN